MGDVTGKDDANKNLGDIASAAEDPPITRKEHNESMDFMRKMMEEMRQMRVDFDNLRNQVPIAPNANSQLANTALGGNSTNGTTSTSEEGKGASQDPKVDAGREHTNWPPPQHYSTPTHIPMPHINSLGPPPMIDASIFSNWQFLMKSHLSSSCTQLWRVIMSGFKPVDPTNLSAKEEIDNQLNATTLNIIQ